eukprot:tig00000459_g1149.t1
MSLNPRPDLFLYEFLDAHWEYRYHTMPRVAARARTNPLFGMEALVLTEVMDSNAQMVLGAVRATMAPLEPMQRLAVQARMRQDIRAFLDGMQELKGLLK